MSNQKKKVVGLRWYMVGMLCVASELNYLDRQTLSVLAQTIQDELHITTMQYADITSAFLISYTIMYAVSGRLVDILGTRRSFAIFVSGWSIANMLHALARTASQLTFFRFLLGMMEPASFPAGVKTVSQWFPMRERALAVGIFNAGTAVGSALAAPFVAFIAINWGWRYAFVAGGLLGLIWVVVWMIMYRIPREHPRLSEEELALIEEGQPTNVEPPVRVPILRLLSMRETWGCILARAMTDPLSYFFIFWIPKFLQSERGYTLAEIGKYAWIPFVAGALGNVFSGAFPRWLTYLGWSVNRSRKTSMLTASCLMPVWLLLIVYGDPAYALVLLSLVMFFHSAWGNITLPAEKFPSHVVGTITGFGGCVGGAVGVLTQQAIGWTITNHSFAPVFIACAFVHITAFLVVSYLVGELGRVRDVSK
jgi:MFS transporter, ACS family, hexuronate transporter